MIDAEMGQIVKIFSWAPMSDTLLDLQIYGYVLDRPGDQNS